MKNGLLNSSYQIGGRAIESTGMSESGATNMVGANHTHQCCVLVHG